MICFSRTISFTVTLSLLLQCGWGAAAEPVVRLEQGWQPGWQVGQTNWFHHASQGTMLLPYDWFMALEQPSISPEQEPKSFSDPGFLAGFGFLRSEEDPNYNPGKLPIGFAIASNWIDPNDATPRPMKAVGLTCAACHTGEITYRGKRLRIEGGSAMIDLGAFQKALGLALLMTNSSSDKFAAFANRWFAYQHFPPEMEAPAKAQLKKALERAVAKGLQEQSLEEELGLHPVEAGFGRTDALARIGNKVFGKLSSVNLSETDAPVNFPHLWDTPWFYWVQYNASIRLPMVRNIGQALGVGAAVHAADENLSTFDSTVDVRNLHLMESQLAGEEPFGGLHAPAWPTEHFGEIEGLKEGDGLWLKGRQLYEIHCVHCHPLIEDFQQSLDVVSGNDYWSRPNQFDRKFMKLAFINFVDIGTDPAAVVKFHRRIVYVGSQKIGGVQGTVSAVDALDFVTMKVRERAYAKLHLSPGDQAAYDGFRELSPEPGAVARLAYKARPLNGIWATAPFLHNGSVANLYQLLLPAEQRLKSFYVGSTEFDPKHVGFDTTWRAAAFRMDTSLPGNLNTGHEFRDLTLQEKASLTPFQKQKLAEGRGWAVNGVLGRELKDDERWALIEYLKSLGSPQPSEKLQASEYPPEGEAESIQQLAQIQASIQQHIVGADKRGQHFKSHGLLWARLRVADDLLEQYRVGIFRQPGDYTAVIRFSNGENPDDRQPDVHGMAIKVFVPREPADLASGASTSQNAVAHEPVNIDQQDFVLADNPVFFAKNVRHLLRFLALRKSNTPIPQLLAEFPRLGTYKKPMASPLGATYWSQTPYKFGTSAVKYQAVPSPENADPEIAAGQRDDQDFLRKTIQERLIHRKRPTSFDFCIQLQTDAYAMPIEDATVEWTSKSIKLATITIYPQNFNSAERLEMDKSISFSPWRALPEHSPLGGINRARRPIYEASRSLRHQASRVEEPVLTGREDF